MRARIIVVVSALALSGMLTTGAAFAQTAGRAANDGGIPPEPTGSPQYNRSGQVVASPEGTESTASNCAARFHSFDPATGTYLGRDGRHHPCP